MSKNTKIVTGVINLYSLMPEALDDFMADSVDLDLEEYLDKHPNEEINSWEGSSLYLYGFRKGSGGKYEPDEKSEFSAIIRTESNVMQIVRSSHACWCRQCSPCYPNQGDLDTPGHDYLAYAPTPDCFDDDEKGKQFVSRLIALS